MTQALTQDQVQQLRKEFDADPRNRLMQNAVTRTPVADVALDRAVVTGIDHSVSHLLDDWKVTNQKKSGRCWLFAGLNLLRVHTARTLGVKDFEYSQSHLLFWDKLEKANYLFEAIIDTADRDVDDRTVAHLLSDPTGDGGQWNMFVSLVHKHGLVPKVAMPETDSSSNTGPMNAVLSTLLRQGARDLRALQPQGAEAMRACKEQLLATIHRVLSIHLGTPPERFLWQWTDKDHGFHREGWMTPQEFAARYVDLDLDDYVCVVHDPRAGSPARADVHRRVPRQRRRRAPRDLPQHRHRPAEVADDGHHPRRRAGLVRLRRGQDDQRRAGHLGRPALRLRRRLLHPARPRQGRPAAAPRRDDDPRDALHRVSTSSTAPRAAGGSRTAGATRRPTRASTR